MVFEYPEEHKEAVQIAYCLVHNKVPTDEEIAVEIAKDCKIAQEYFDEEVLMADVTISVNITDVAKKMKDRK